MQSPGFCDAERDGFAALLSLGLKDVWRDANPMQRQFTYYSARFDSRAKNIGWRLDYALTDVAGTEVAVRSDFPGTDHLPLAVLLPVQ